MTINSLVANLDIFSIPSVYMVVKESPVLDVTVISQEPAVSVVLSKQVDLLFIVRSNKGSAIMGSYGIATNVLEIYKYNNFCIF